MSEQKIVTPIGFIEVKIEVDNSIPKETLQLIRSSIRIISLESSFRSTINALIGEKASIPVKPGKYRITCYLGDLNSEPAEICLEAGQVSKLRFYFGKE
jgi:hypothetical protein